MRHTILLVDDDGRDLEATRELLEKQGYVVDTALGGPQAIRQIQKHPHLYSLVILDYRMAGQNGAETAREISAHNSKLFLLVYSGDDTRDALKDCYRSGVIDFIDKAEGTQALLRAIRNWCIKFEETKALIAEDEGLNENEKLIASVGMIGRSPELAQIARTILKYRGNAARVVIVGQRGTGKELVAEALHRGNGKFIPKNCAVWAANPQLMPSDLFGTVKGSFTGAEQKLGSLRAARGGTVFLDELHTLSKNNQQILLRVLQSKKVTPVGDENEYPIDCRFIAAAQPEIFDLIKRGEFQADLWDRLGTKVIDIPALAQRPEDIEPLVRFFCKQYGEEYGFKKAFRRRTVRIFEKYSWPGNVRELATTVERLVIDTPKDQYEITPDDLDAKFFPDLQGNGKVKLRTLEEVVKEHVIQMERKASSISDAARQLGLPRTSYRNLLVKFGLLGQKRGTGSGTE